MSDRKYDTFDTDVAETLPPISNDLFHFMHGLDRTGLNWDTNDVMETLEDVVTLEAIAEAAKELRIQMLVSRTEILKGKPTKSMKVIAGLIQHWVNQFADLENLTPPAK